MKKILIVVLIALSSFLLHPKDYHQVVFMPPNCVMDIYAWVTYSMVHRLRVETWNYTVNINCGGNVVTATWSVSPDRIINNLNGITEQEAREVTDMVESEMK